MLLLHDSCVLARRHSFSLAFQVCSYQTHMNGSPGKGSLPRCQQPSSDPFTGRQITSKAGSSILDWIKKKGIYHMNTSHLSQTAPLAVVPSLPPLLAWVSVLLHHVKAFQMHTLEIQEPSEQIYHPIPLLVTPVRFSGKGIYTPLQDWNGYR